MRIKTNPHIDKYRCDWLTRNQAKLTARVTRDYDSRRATTLKSVDGENGGCETESRQKKKTNEWKNDLKTRKNSRDFKETNARKRESNENPCCKTNRPTGRPIYNHKNNKRSTQITNKQKTTKPKTLGHIPLPLRRHLASLDCRIKSVGEENSIKIQAKSVVNRPTQTSIIRRSVKYLCIQKKIVWNQSMIKCSFGVVEILKIF